ncbi:L-methionine/D-methionine ABC transporter membrane subunit [Azospirillaceae bacterium]
MSPQIYALLADATIETLFMVGVSGLVATALGLPLGVALAITGRDDLLPCLLFNRTVGVVINATRSTPFIILMVAIIPFTRLVTGTSIGPLAAIVPLIVAATPFIARVVDAAIRNVDVGLIETATSMGASPKQIIMKVLLPEALPAIILGLTLAIVSLIGYSAMVGAVGGGGLGDLGIRYGYQRFQPEMMAATVAALIVLVQLVQSIGERAARRMDRRRST